MKLRNFFTTSNEGEEQMSSFALRPSDDVAKVECHAALPRDGASLRVHSMPRRLAAGSFTLALFVGLSELAGIIGSIFTVSEISVWYDTLVKPVLHPPSFIFAPVWTMLYVLMGVAAFLVWREGWEKRAVKIALMLFGLQLFLNTIWSIIFFGLHNPLGALIDIVLLLLAIVMTMFSFYKVSCPATLLFIPYLLWVTFASYLNYAIWVLNA